MNKAVEKSAEKMGETVNTSPMIDMVFILLIFFVVAAVFVEELGFATETPDPVPTTAVTEDQTMGIHLDAANRAFVDGEQIPLEAIQVKVAQRFAMNSETRVLVHARELTQAGFLVGVLDQVRLGGVETVSVSLEND